MSNQQLSNLAKTWKSRIDQWQTSGKSLTAWSKENGLVYSQSFYWKSRFLEQNNCKSNTLTAGSFIELQNQPASESGIVVEISAAKIHLSTDFDQSTFLRCVNLLRRKTC